MIWNLIYHQCSGATLSHISTHVFMFYTIYNTFTSTKSYQGFTVIDINICAFFFTYFSPFHLSVIRIVHLIYILL